MSKNLDLMLAAFRAVEAGDLDTAQDMLAEDFIANLPGSDEPRRGRAIWAFLPAGRWPPPEEPAHR